jgi:hypothetical protein
MPGPIRHIVMWRLRGDAAEERAAARLKVKDAPAPFAVAA